MNSAVGAYCRALLTGTVSRLSGLTGVILAFVGLYFDTATNRSMAWIAAAACLFLAGYDAWRAEFDRHLDLENRAKLPKFLGIFTFLEYADLAPGSSSARMIVQFQNVSYAACGVSRLVITASNRSGTKTITPSTEMLGIRRKAEEQFSFAGVMYEKGEPQNISQLT